MRALLLPVCAVAVAAVGCRGFGSRFDPCPPPCPAESCPVPAAECAEETVVRAPAPKVVVETQAAHVQQPAAAQAVVAPQAVAQSVPGMALATGGGNMVTGEVRERTRLGFAFDFIRIPIPVLRPIAVQRPTEVTFRTPISQAQVSGAGFVATTPMAMAVPVGGVGMSAGVPMGGVPIGGMGMSTGFVPQPAVGYQQVTVQGQIPGGQAALAQAAFGQAGGGALNLTPQQVAALQALAAQGGGAGSALGASGGGAAQAAGGGDAAATLDRIKAAEADMKRLEAQCKELELLKQRLKENK